MKGPEREREGGKLGRREKESSREIELEGEGKEWEIKNDGRKIDGGGMLLACTYLATIRRIQVTYNKH